MIKKAFTALFMIFSLATAAQTSNQFNDQAIHNVAQIDEFVERFNNDSVTRVKEYFNKLYPGHELTREQLLKSLFNGSKKWDQEQMKLFIAAVNDKNNPQYLSFSPGEWYALVNCAVTWKKKPQHATLILKLKHTYNDAYKWVVTGVEAPFLHQQYPSKNQTFTFPAPHDSTAFFNPVSHATNFMNIDLISTDKKNIADYFFKSDKYDDDVPAFVTECVNGNISVRYSVSTTYYFMQIKGWKVEIKEFSRQSNNSGWLISSLAKADTLKNAPIIPPSNK